MSRTGVHISAARNTHLTETERILSESVHQLLANSTDTPGSGEKGEMPLFKKKYWYTPPLEIIGGGNMSDTDTIINPEYIAALLNNIGLPCTPAGHTTGAQIATYHFNLISLKDYSKANRAVKALSAALQTPCTLTPSDRAHIAIQAARAARELVALRQTVQHLRPDRTPTTVALGLDDAGQPVIVDIAKMPHMLIAGATGSGKSVALNTILCSMLYCATPTMTQFVMIDPKQVELSIYAGLPHLASPIITSAGEAVKTLQSVNTAMDRRYKTMARKGTKSGAEAGYPNLVIVIDELADLMLTSKKAVEESIIRIAQLGRAAGIHLLVATQKPVVSVVTGLIQGNIPCKLALQTASTGDSVRILGHKGAETLLGKGDAWLKLPDQVQEIRVQCAYTSDQDIAAIVNYWKHDAKRRG
jgi:S-DNA-T family DNA segregation ATPase FtsK/SpoIIIE